MGSSRSSCDAESLACELGTRKDVIVRYVQKHFVAGVQYTASPVPNRCGKGRPEVVYVLRPDAADLVRDTYGLKHRYVTRVGPGVRHVNALLMSPENATVGFLCRALHGVTPAIREHRVGNYRIDLYLPEVRLAVECDEQGHAPYDQNAERAREDAIRASLGCTFLRFDPAEPGFDLARVVGDVLSRLLAARGGAGLYRCH